MGRRGRDIVSQKKLKTIPSMVTPSRKGISLDRLLEEQGVDGPYQELRPLQSAPEKEDPRTPDLENHQG